jgi:hypothetical protein
MLRKVVDGPAAAAFAGDGDGEGANVCGGPDGVAKLTQTNP